MFGLKLKNESVSGDLLTDLGMTFGSLSKGRRWSEAVSMLIEQKAAYGSCRGRAFPESQDSSSEHASKLQEPWFQNSACRSLR